MSTKELSARIACWLRLGYGAIMAFAMLGILMGNHLGEVIAIVTALTWVVVSIFNEAVGAWQLLSAIRNKQIVFEDSENPPPKGGPSDPDAMA